MIVHSGAAQMIVPGPETNPGYAPGVWLCHNTSTTTEIYLDTGLNVQAVPGSSNFIIPPGATISLTGWQTFYARTPDGTTADLHIVPTAPFAQPAPAGSVTGAIAYSAG